MKLIVGLGNPGKEYEKTRHNVGFQVIDRFAQQCQVDISTKKFKGEYIKMKYKGEDIILLKPMTYMNNSGESVRLVMDYFRLSPEDLLVIYDDMDISVGRLRLREGGGAGGHNGIKSLIQHVGSQSFQRIRVGIDKSPMIPVVDYVLGVFQKNEQPLIDTGIEKAVDAIHMSITKGFIMAMNTFNERRDT